MTTFALRPWTPGILLENLPGQLPPATLPKEPDLGPIAGLAQQVFGNPESLAADHVLWTDMLALTNFVKTHSGTDVARTWHERTTLLTARDFKIITPARVARITETLNWVVISFAFRTTDNGLVGDCTGNMAFVPEVKGGGWKLWMISTILESYRGYGHPDAPRPSLLPRPVTNARPDFSMPDAVTRLDHTVIVIGAGQAGLSLGGRLQALNIPYTILEKASSVSMKWTGRYEAVRQHTIHHYNNLPFGPTWTDAKEDYLPGEAVAQGHRKWVERWRINVRFNADVKHVRRVGGIWHVRYTDYKDEGSDTLTSRHVIFALGAASTIDKRPAQFPGEQLTKTTVSHMVTYKNGGTFKGRNVVLVGSGTASHDIAMNLLKHDVKSVTMLQRDMTAVYPIEWYSRSQRAGYEPHPSQTSRKVSATGSKMQQQRLPPQMLHQDALADRHQLSMPFKFAALASRQSYALYLTQHKDYFDAITATGFRLDTSSSPAEDVLNHYGRYYLDVGATPKIIDGTIKIKSPVQIESFVPGNKDIVLTSGELLKDVDDLIFATGYQSDYRLDIAPLLDEEVLQQLEPWWGVNKNGDLRGLLDEGSRYEREKLGIWMFGGAAVHARFLSRFVALRILRSEVLSGRIGKSEEMPGRKQRSGRL